MSAYRTASAQDDIDDAQDAAISAKYTKPSSGIPKTDLASAVQTSLGKADSALQEHQDISGKQDVISDLSTIRSGASKGATAVQPESGKGLFSGNYNDLTNKPTIPAAVTDAHINSLIDAKLGALDGNGVAY